MTPHIPLGLRSSHCKHTLSDSLGPSGLGSPRRRRAEVTFQLPLLVLLAVFFVNVRKKRSESMQ